MDSNNSKISIATVSSSRRRSTRLLYDRRYGWVFDEWKDPSEEALAGGRGMFCILPLAKTFLNSASQSINFAANFAVEVLQRPELISPQALHTHLDKQLTKFRSSMKKPVINCFDLNGKFPSQTPTFPSHLPIETRESQTT